MILGKVMPAVVAATPLLLDTYSGATVAVSVRKLRTAYTGYCMQVKRSSDNTTLDIGFVNDLVDTAAILTFAGSSKGSVTIWYDQSGNNKDMAPETSRGGVPPVICNSGSVNLWGTKPTILWDGTMNMGYMTPLYSVSQPNTIFMIGKNSSAAHYTDGYNGRQIVSTSLIYAGTSLACTTPSTPHIRYALFNGANSQSRANNSTLYTGNAGTNSNDMFHYVGYYWPGSYSIVGGIQELILYASNKSSIKDNVRDNQNAYFSVY
ncbi:MAG: arabinofuranosidase catalytic domain-containing protein [Bacteroidota bacterium]